MDEMEKSMMDEIITKLEDLFKENPQYNMKKLNSYLNRTGELTLAVNRIKEEIQTENPGISREELIELASQRIATMVQEREDELQQPNNENETRED